MAEATVRLQLHTITGENHLQRPTGSAKGPSLKIDKIETMTADEFITRRHELPDGGRWTELVAGTPQSMTPPDQKHGDVMLNVSRNVAGALSPERPVFASFEVGVVTRKGPDTVRFPAVSVFRSGGLFDQIDSMLAEQCPALVMEIVSANDRRRTIAERVYEYQDAGVEKVWVIDPDAEQVTVLRKSAAPVTFSEEERLADIALLPDFEIPAREIFAEPSWWQG